MSSSATQKLGASQRTSTAAQPRRKGRSQQSKSRSKSKPRSQSHETADVIKRRVTQQFNNYMEHKIALDESLSLLAESRATPPRDEKKLILKQQKLKRK